MNEWLLMIIGLLIVGKFIMIGLEWIGRWADGK